VGRGGRVQRHLHNGDFEEGFSGPAGLVVPDGWTPYYSRQSAPTCRPDDTYTVYAAWSDNGGSAWTGPEAITANRDASGSTTGAIGPDVWPLISLETEPPSGQLLLHLRDGRPTAQYRLPAASAVPT
jgi:hypothetical protein